ncbi:hypothetical protein ACI7RC_02510 [Brevibacillus sp. B_LB10_24]|uniref:hypothetical protein n=1 Tax=Brevibacillus sp. B_LB10_24 TaxID=3380645 RepID=UPI0038BB6B0A
MITIGLTKMQNMRPVVRYGVSPLFEMAVSLHTLSSQSPPIQHYNWVKQTIDRLRQENLYREFLYFSPLFMESTPRFFDPDATDHVKGVDDLYEYLLALPQGEFVEGVNEALLAAKKGSADIIYPIEKGLRDDPAVIKSRFTLLTASYLQAVFMAKWEELAPKLVAEVEWAEQELSTANDVGVFLQRLVPEIGYNEEDNHLLIQQEDGAEAHYDITDIVFQPSLFFSTPPRYSLSGKTLHVTYNVNSRRVE